MAKGATRTTGSHLTLSIWHPGCWTLEVTEHANGGLFGHGVYPVDGKVKGRFTVYADSDEALEALTAAIEASPHTDTVWRLDASYDFASRLPTPGNATQSVVVEYDEGTSINDALVSNGFIPDKAVWIHDGREFWTVVIDEDREQIKARLEEVRETMDAEIDIQHIVSDNRESGGVLRQDILSERQRDVFELARERGYYEWPREVNATELAAELDLSKATVLEHLRKAESRLFDALP